MNTNQRIVDESLGTQAVVRSSHVTIRAWMPREIPLGYNGVQVSKKLIIPDKMHETAYAMNIVAWLGDSRVQ